MSAPKKAKPVRIAEAVTVTRKLHLVHRGTEIADVDAIFEAMTGEEFYRAINAILKPLGATLVNGECRVMRGRRIEDSSIEEVES